MNEVVLDDVLEIGPGDQVVVDGDVVDSASLEVDESLLTGESETVPKPPGSSIMSGSFVSAGTGRYQATKVGRDAYAVSLAEEARRFTLVRSELRSGIDTIIKYASWAMVPTAILLLVSQLQATDSVSDALRTSVGGVVAMVPEGLVLLTSVAFAVGVVRLGKVNMLVQELPAVEGLARVDVLCLDKTGTLTEGAIAVQSVETIGDGAESVQDALAALAAADPSPNATSLALRRGLPLEPGLAGNGSRSRSRPCGSGARSSSSSTARGSSGRLTSSSPSHTRRRPISTPASRAGRGAGQGRAARGAAGVLTPTAERRRAADRSHPEGARAARRQDPHRRGRHPRLLRRAGRDREGDLRRPSRDRRRRRPPMRHPRGRSGRRSDAAGRSRSAWAWRSRRRPCSAG